MTIESRLKTCKAYREEALLNPEENKLYIEDLDLSIAMFEKAVKSKREHKYLVQKGFDLAEET